MNQASFSALAVSAAIFVGFLVVAFLWRKMVSRRISREVDRVNLERQNFVISRSDEIGRLLGNSTLRADELKRMTDSLVAELETRNDNGCLDAYLADTREFLGEEIAKRG